MTNSIATWRTTAPSPSNSHASGITPIRRRLAAVLFLTCLASGTLAAHDMWIEPSTYAPEAGDIVPVRLRVGQGFLGDPLARDTALIRQFVYEDASGRRSLVGRDGADPAGFLRVATPGLTVVGYFSNPSSVELSAETFNQYLKDEGLDAIAALRAERHQTMAPAKEVFTRCAKSLLLSGDARPEQGDRRLGFTLELFAEKNPYAMRPGDTLPVRLTYENRPLRSALVVAINRRHPSEIRTARTDADGRVQLALPTGGTWLVKAVHMVPAPSGTGAEWASYWASLTFQLPAAAGAN